MEGEGDSALSIGYVRFVRAPLNVATARPTGRCCIRCVGTPRLPLITMAKLSARADLISHCRFRARYMLTGKDLASEGEPRERPAYGTCNGEWRLHAPNLSD